MTIDNNEIPGQSTRASGPPLSLLAAAISDPGHWTPRGDNYEERLIDWEARSVLLALAAAGYVVLPDQPDHFITFDSDGWFVEHSIACRVAGTIGTCDYNGAARELDDEFDAELIGRWRMVSIDSEGLPEVERADG